MSNPQFPNSWGVVMRGSGWALGLADSAYAASTVFKAIPKVQFFGEGWGDMSRAEQCRSRLHDFVRTYQSAKQIPNVVMSSLYTVPGGTVHESSFQCVLGEFLPDTSRTCDFELVVPNGVVRACVLIMPGTGDQSYTFRRSSLAVPLLQHGIASIIPMAPLYGSRRPSSQWLHYISNVADYAIQSCVLVTEGMQLLDWAEERFRCSLGVTGISWGGAMVSAIGILAKRHDLAVTPCLPSASAAVLVTGALRREVAMARLAKERNVSEAEAEASLLAFLNASDLEDARRLTEPFGAGARAVVQVSAANDTFVPPEEGLQAFAILRQVDPEAKLVWVPGGHVAAHAGARFLFVGPVLRSLRLLSDRLARPSRSRL